MSQEDREFLLVKYQADRAHNLELMRSLHDLESSGWISWLLILNGASATAFLTAFSQLDTTKTARAICLAAIFVWLLGALAGFISMGRFRQFRLRKLNAAELRAAALAYQIYGRNDANVSMTPAEGDSQTYRDMATENEVKRDASYEEMGNWALVSLGFFCLGVITAVTALLIS